MLCDDDLNVIEYRGDTSAYMVNPSGPPITNLQRLARPEVFLPLNEAIRQARQDGVAVRKTGLRTGGLGGLQATSVVSYKFIELFSPRTKVLCVALIRGGGDERTAQTRTRAE